MPDREPVEKQLEHYYGEYGVRNEKTLYEGEALTCLDAYKSFSDFKRELAGLFLVPIINLFMIRDSLNHVLLELAIASVEIMTLNLRGFARLGTAISYLIDACESTVYLISETIATCFAFYMRSCATVAEGAGALVYYLFMGLGAIFQSEPLDSEVQAEAQARAEAQAQQARAETQRPQQARTTNEEIAGASRAPLYPHLWEDVRPSAPLPSAPRARFFGGVNVETATAISDEQRIQEILASYEHEGQKEALIEALCALQVSDPKTVEHALRNILEPSQSYTAHYMH